MVHGKDIMAYYIFLIECPKCKFQQQTMNEGKHINGKVRCTKCLKWFDKKENKIRRLT